MKNKRTLWLAIAGTALLGITILCVLTGYGLVRWFYEGGPNIFVGLDRYQGTVEETVTYEVGDATGVRMDWSSGDITLEETDGDEIVMELVKESGGTTEEEAKANAAALTVVREERNGWLTFSFRQPDRPDQLIFDDIDSSINVKLYLPKGLAADLNTNAGDLMVSGFNNDLTLFNRFGNIDVTDQSGALNVESDSGEIELTNIDAGNNPVTFKTNFGDITLKNVRAGDAEIGSRNGQIKVTDLSADVCSITDDFGGVKVSGFSCDSLSVILKNGNIDLSNGTVSGELEISPDFGTVSVRDVDAGSYQVESGNGDIDLDGVTGVVTVDGGFGNIEIVNAVDVVLDLQNDNGKIFFSGSLSPEHDQTVVSQFGTVTMVLPEGINLDIDLKTQFGTIKSDFPVTLQGQIEPTSMQGQLNDGGILLKIEANNGDIVLQVTQ